MDGFENIEKNMPKYQDEKARSYLIKVNKIII